MLRAAICVAAGFSPPGGLKTAPTRGDRGDVPLPASGA